VAMDSKDTKLWSNAAVVGCRNGHRGQSLKAVLRDAAALFVFFLFFVDMDSKDNLLWFNRPLWGAAGAWAGGVVKLLLETGKVDVDSKGYWVWSKRRCRGAPFSGNGHEGSREAAARGRQGGYGLEGG